MTPDIDTWRPSRRDRLITVLSMLLTHAMHSGWRN